MDLDQLNAKFDAKFDEITFALKIWLQWTYNIIMLRTSF